MTWFSQRKSCTLFSMTLTTHAIVGAAAASMFPSHPIFAVSMSLATHYVMDSIPHIDYHLHSDSINPHIGAKIKLDADFFRDVFTVGAESDAPYFPVVAVEGQQLFASRGVPDSRLPVQSTGRNPLAIGAESHTHG